MLRAKMEWFRRERTLRAANKLWEALEKFRALSSIDNFGGAQLVRLSLAEDLCRELGEMQAAKALAERSEVAARSNEEALAKQEAYRRKRRQRVPKADQGDTREETRTDIQAAQERPRRVRRSANTAALTAAK